MNNLNEQLIAFKRGCILVHRSDQKLPEGPTITALVSLIEELGRLGYRLPSEIMASISESEIKDVFDYVIPEIRRITLGGHSIAPLYPGFPEQTAGITEEQRRIDQLRCYNGDLAGFLRDNPWEKPLGTPRIRTRNYLKLMSEKEFMEIPTCIMTAGNSITPEDMELLEWFLGEYPNLSIPERIPFKEILCLVLKYHPELVRDINDIVRFGMYLMGSNPALPHIPKMIKKNAWDKYETKNPEHRNLKSLPRKSRIGILEMVEKVILEKGFSECIKDSKRFYGSWLLLSERVHPGDYVSKYPKAWEFFDTLKNRKKSIVFRTWYSELQEMYDRKASTIEIAKYISRRPGEFVRKFDSLIRRNSKKDSAEVLEIFMDTPEMKNKTLLSLHDYYDRRGGKRVIMIPGKRIPITLPALPKMDDDILKATKYVIWNKIAKNIQNYIKEKDLEGKIVYLDNEIKNIPIPVGMRDNQSQIPTGTRFNIPKSEKTVRFFIHWVQKETECEDLDLHGYFFNSTNNREETIGWNRRLSSLCAVHSGDVRNRPGDCAEFIDVDLDEAKKEGWTHVLMDVNNYYGKGFDTLECTLGYMLRGCSGLESKNNLDWFPMTSDIEHSIRPITKAASIMAFVIDLKNRQVIIIDRDLNGIPISSEHSGKGGLVEFFCRKQTVTSYDVLKVWYEARGAKVQSNPEEITDDIIKISFQDILNDYTKISEAIGE